MRALSTRRIAGGMLHAYGWSRCLSGRSLVTLSVVLVVLLVWGASVCDGFLDLCAVVLRMGSAS